MAIEKTKILEIMKQEKLKRKNYLSNLDNNSKIDTTKTDYNNKNLNKDSLLIDGIIEEENEIEIPFDSINSNSSLSLNEKENEKDKNIEKETNMDYKKFKERFVTALKELEKDKKNEDLYEFLNFDEDYLYNLYTNVYKNNPDYQFIFENPLLILNYIFIEINKANDKDKKKNLIEQSLNISKIKEENNSLQSSISLKKSNKGGKKDNRNLSSSSISSNSSISEEKSNSGSKNSKEKKKGLENNNLNGDNLELNRINTLTKKFLLSQMLYDYNSKEIEERKEISFSIICHKKSLIEAIPNQGNIRKNTGKKNTRERENTFFVLYPKRKSKNRDNQKTFINEGDKLLNLSKDLSKEKEIEKTFAIIQRNNRNKLNHDKTESNLTETISNLGFQKSSKKLKKFSFSKNSKSKSNKRSKNKDKENIESKTKFNNDNFNYLKKKKINYMPFINKDKSDSEFPKTTKNKLNANINTKNKKDNDKYFNLAKEIDKYEKKNNKDQKRGAKSTDINEKEYQQKKNIKKKDMDIYLNISTDKYDDQQDISYSNFSNSRRKNKNKSYNFKTKEEREKELEEGAIKYLKNEYKNKNKSGNYKNINGNGKGYILPKKKVYNKSTDNKKNENFNLNKYLKNNKYLNNVNNKEGKRNEKGKKSNKFNSRTTKNSSNSGNYNKINKNDSSLTNSNNENKNNEFNVFQSEFKKIMNFNKKMKNDSQENNKKNQNYKKKSLNLKTEEIQDDNNEESEYTDTDCHNKYKEYLYHRNMHSMPKKKNNNPSYPVNEGKKYPMKNIPNRKYNAISSTNYTNTDTPKNTVKNTFPGKQQNNNSRLKIYSRELKKNNKYN